MTALAAPAHAETARPADAFVDSVGVNTHLSYLDTPYRDFPKVRARLNELGVRHIRDGVSWQRQPFRTLAADGIQTNFIIGEPAKGRTPPLAEQLTAVKNDLLGAVSTIEAPNEWDNYGPANQTWVTDLRDYQQRLHDAVRNDPAFGRIGIVAPSLVFSWTNPTSWQRLGDLSAQLDYGNLHSYAGGQIPESNLNAELGRAAQVAAGKPVIATEAGYHNAVAAHTTHPPVSEHAAATYMPRLFLEYFRRGVHRTYSYELLDEWPARTQTDPEASFGLLRGDYTPKPAFIALRNTLDILADDGTARARDLHLAVTGPATLRHVLLARSDGTYDLAIWNAVSVWNPTARKATASAPAAAAITLPGRFSAAVYRPAAAAAPVGGLPASSRHTLAVGPDVTILRLANEPLPPSPAEPETATPTPAPVPTRTPSVATPTPTAVSTPAPTATPGPDGNTGANPRRLALIKLRTSRMPKQLRRGRILKVTVTPSRRVRSVAVFVDRRRAAVDRKAPYRFRIRTKALRPGKHSVRLRARTASARVTSPAKSFVVRR